MRIMILHASAGGGHRRAAEALAHAFDRLDPDVDVQVCDILDFTPTVFRQTYAKGYLRLVRSAPELWGYFYLHSDRTARIPWRRKVRTTFNRINTVKFLRAYDRFNPDAVICTHFMPLELVAERARRHNYNTPLCCCVTDYAVHSLWMIENVPTYYVAGTEAARQLVRRGHPTDSVKVTGIPVDPVFETAEPPDAARRRLGLNPSQRTVLILSGGFGVGPTTELLASFRETSLNLQLIVVCGANEELRREVTDIAATLSQPVQVHGFVNNIHEMIDASDIVISKPGGLTTSEVLAKGKPMMVVDPIPGQEQRNCEFILEKGAGVRLYEAADAAHKLERVLAQPGALEHMCMHAREAGRPHAAMDIARDVIRQIQASQTPPELPVRSRRPSPSPSA